MYCKQIENQTTTQQLATARARYACNIQLKNNTRLRDQMRSSRHRANELELVFERKKLKQHRTQLQQLTTKLRLDIDEKEKLIEFVKDLKNHINQPAQPSNSSLQLFCSNALSDDKTTRSMIGMTVEHFYDLLLHCTDQFSVTTQGGLQRTYERAENEESVSDEH